MLLELRVKSQVLAHHIKQIFLLLTAALPCKISKDGDYVLFFLAIIRSVWHIDVAQ